MIGTTVGDVDHVVGQHRGQPGDVTFEDRREEGIGQLLHLGRRRRQARAAVTDLLTRSARHLAGGGLVAIDRGGNLGERNCEHVVQEEDRPLGRIQRLEHAEEPEGERVRRRHDLGRIRGGTAHR